MSFFKKPRPDFSQAEVRLYDFTIKFPGKTEYGIHAVFPEYPVEKAMKNGWITDYYEYMIIADLEFRRRHPNHDFSKEAWPNLKWSDDLILAIAQGTKKLTLIRDKENVTITVQ